jgi:squalene synthase HpnC
VETIAKAFEPATDIAAAEAYARQLTDEHYENFSVVSLLLPRHLRQDFCNVYAFCRTADDLGDEVGDRAEAQQLLSRFRDDLLATYNGDARSLVFTALSQTIRRHEIPAEPFLDLIDAFQQDQRVGRYETTEALLDYCRRSADPVGRLVLYLCGYRDETRQRLSDCICTALQLANFWQDVRRDLLDLDRIYLPKESMNRFGVTEESLRNAVDQRRCDDRLRGLIRFEVDRTAAIFDAGEALLPMLRPEVRRQVALFAAGGRAILDAIRRRNYDTVTGRPALSKWTKARLMAPMLPSVVSGLFSRGEGA